MKNIIIILFFTLLLGCKQSIIGDYSNCGSESYGCSFLKLSDDKSFKYGTPSHGHMGDKETSGTYEIKGDTIILNNYLDFHSITHSKTESFSDSFQVIQITQAYNDLKQNNCGFAKVITDDNLTFLADTSGFVKIRKNSFDSLRIEYVGCNIEWIDLSDKILNQDSITIQCNLENGGHPELVDFKFLMRNDSLLCLEYPYEPWHLKRNKN